MEYDEGTITSVIERAIDADEEGEPAFYGVGGSHLYGFPDGGGDVDVRGFHVADGDRYALLDEPVDRIAVNQDGVTEGFEEESHVDFVSYELKKFGRMVHSGNFNAVELVCCAEPAFEERADAVDDLRSLIEERLPMDVPRAYYGMATGTYTRHLDPDRDGYDPSAKNYLYVLRGLLAAEHVAEEATVEADVRALAEAGLGDADLVEDLIAAKRDGETPGADLKERAEARIGDLLDRVEVDQDVSKPGFDDAIDEWMLSVRE